MIHYTPKLLVRPAENGSLKEIRLPVSNSGTEGQLPKRAELLTSSATYQRKKRTDGRIFLCCMQIIVFCADFALTQPKADLGKLS